MKALDELELAGTRSSSSPRTTGPKGWRAGPQHPGAQSDRNRGSTGGLRGRKRDCTKGASASRASSAGRGRSGRASVSDVPVIGTDIFTTVCAIVGIPLPSDRTIDGADMRPAFEGKPIQRSRPLYWRTHIAAPSCRAALRIGDWKIVADEDLTRFELYNLAADPHEYQRPLSQESRDACQAQGGPDPDGRRGQGRGARLVEAGTNA